MATKDFTVGNVAAYPSEGQPVLYNKQAVIDCSTDNAASADIFQMIDVAEDEIVLLVGLEVLTLEGGTLTVDVGDGDDADGYLDGVDCNGTAGDKYASQGAYAASTTNADMDMTTPTELFALRGGKHYTAADTIDITFNNAADAAKLRLTAAVLNIWGQQTTGNTEVT